MKKYLPIVLRVLLTIMFIGPAIMKLTANPMIVESFTHFGYPMWFMYFIGIAELLGALAIAGGSFINKKIPALAVLGLSVIMVGAIGSHIIAGDPLMTVTPTFVYLILLLVYLKVMKR